MKFLIQKINHQIRHDFSFTLMESIRYQNWLQNNKKAITVKFIDYINNYLNLSEWDFKPFHKHYIPIGSVEFVLGWMKQFNIPIPKPMNIPEELFGFCHRKVFNGNHMDLEDLEGKYFIKTNDKIKGICGIITTKSNEIEIPVGNYQISKLTNIGSEWRAFIYNGKLVGLQNYCGEFTKFPNVNNIKSMILAYKSAPIAYTLDVGVNDYHTFVIECHDFFSCGLYGFANHNILPYMFYRWFHEYLNKIKNGK